MGRLAAHFARLGPLLRPGLFAQIAKKQDEGTEELKATHWLVFLIGATEKGRWRKKGSDEMRCDAGQSGQQ
ncbi:hypothetical protein CMUS01_03401 [Colletotrichum musicola]|uniref:Uncharacterized protein n=1 Tax=Colletotrichum musicola TaxID=2175873 RepID=A0A8H6U5X2_9PEZI|nr:hypothetical protein CMUS01_03401 [Colletotrichum musicola]